MVEENKILKLDLGCGKNKFAPDWTGVDCLKLEGVDIVLNLCELQSNFSEFECVDSKGKKRKPKQGEPLGITAPGKMLFKKWIWEDNSVDEVHCSHFVEHLEPDERIHFVNELYRVLKPGAKATIVVPHWASCRAYGDLTHKWPPISEFWFYYLSSEWRKINSPHVDSEITNNPNHYKCNFVCTWGFTLNLSIQNKNTEHQNFALSNFKEAAQDIIVTFIKS